MVGSSSLHICSAVLLAGALTATDAARKKAVSTGLAQTQTSVGWSEPEGNTDCARNWRNKRLKQSYGQLLVDCQNSCVGTEGCTDITWAPGNGHCILLSGCENAGTNRGWRHFVKQDGDVVVRQATDGPYALGKGKTFACPDGYDMIMNAEDCEKSAVEFGGKFSRVGSYGHSKPYGCYNNGADNKYYFNTNGAVYGGWWRHFADRLFCKKKVQGETPVVYSDATERNDKGETTTATCPDGTWVTKCGSVPPNGEQGVTVSSDGKSCTALSSRDPIIAQATCGSNVATRGAVSSELYLDEQFISIGCGDDETIYCTCATEMKWGADRMCHRKTGFAPTDNKCQREIHASNGRRRLTEVGAGAKLYAICKTR